jgi:hypothetical protein
MPSLYTLQISRFSVTVTFQRADRKCQNNQSRPLLSSSSGYSPSKLATMIKENDSGAPPPSFAVVRDNYSSTDDDASGRA